MTPPNRWLFFPAPASSDPNFTSDGVIETPSGRNCNYQSVTDSGETDNFATRAITLSPLRKNGTDTWVEFLLMVATDNDYTGVADFLAESTNRTYTLKHDGTAFSYTSIAEVNQGDIILRVRFSASTSYVSSWWSGLSAGDDVQFTLTYELGE